MSEEKEKPGYDERTLAKLLEAAYVLQEHNRDSQPAPEPAEPAIVVPAEEVHAVEPAPPAPSAAAAPEPDPKSVHLDPALPLAQIVETQHTIQAHHLALDSAMTLVAARLVEIAHADGAAIGIVDGNIVRYRAVAGARTPATGAEVPLDKALCIPCIRTGEVFRCANVTPKLLIDVAECQRREIQAMIAVPVFHDDAAIGGLELYYSSPRAFSEQDVQTCQLMAGLITEAFDREQQASSKKSLDHERSRMLDVLERLKPNLSALADKKIKEPAAPSRHPCAKCGHELGADEHFCGQCGTPRAGETQTSAEKPAPPVAPAAANKNEAVEKATHELRITESEDTEHILSGTSLDDLAKSLQSEMPEPFVDSDVEGHAPSPELAAALLSVEDSPGEISAAGPSEAKSQTVESAAENSEEAPSKESTALAKSAASADWSSAHSAREFLEQLAGPGGRNTLARFWHERRGDVWLAIAVILVAAVIRWGVWSSPSVNAKASPNNPAAAQHKGPDADLSMFDRMLISLGLAEAPQPPEDRGNPAAQVWVDLHTALYYCPGADLYGKTPTGKYTSQREAQLDQFEPAYRQTCK